MPIGEVRVMVFAVPGITAPTGSVAFTGSPPFTSSYGTSDPGAIYMTYQVNGDSPTNVSFDPTTGNWNSHLTSTDCPTLSEYTLTINAWYPPTPPGNTATCRTGQGTFTRSS